jgi:large subunit ribosomal protein L11
MKLDVSYAQTVKSSSKEIIGTCLSLGIKVEDKVANEIYQDISAGKYDSLLS